MNIGDTFTVNGVDLVVLDFVGNNPLVWAYNVDIQSVFSNDSSNYRTSLLRKNIESWFESTGIQAIEREVNLTALDGWCGYGKIKTKVAPFTFDEYRKYRDIIKKYAKRWFWTATALGEGSSYVCSVGSDGSAGGCGYSSSGGLAPVFILDNNYLNKINNLSDTTIEDLIKELYNRVK